MRYRKELLLSVVYCLMVSSQGAPIAKRVIDMTYTIGDNTALIKDHKKFEMKLLSNGTELFGNDIWVQIEEIASATHSGTHMDAPAHFAKGGKTVDQLDVSRFIAPAAVVDITAKAMLDPEAEADVEDLRHWEHVTGKSLNETILLLRCGWGRKWDDKPAFFGTPDFDHTKMRFPGFSPEAARWLVDNRNVYGIGVETLSIDKGSSTTYGVHRIILGSGMFALENVANMDLIPIYGATLHVMPMKIGDASGAPTRVVATYPDVLYDQHMDGVGKYREECYRH